MTRWVLAIADDLTGALEVGAKFADAVVTTGRIVSQAPAAKALVVDTETRHLTPLEAAEIVRETAESARRFHPWLIYKKTDSTLRGNIAAELRALMQAFPDRPLVYAPAYPEMGRTVRGGHLFVDGVPVHLTAFANDPLNPVRGSSVWEALEGLPATVLDGEQMSHVEAAADEIRRKDPPPLAAGPAALAGCLGAKGAFTPPRLRRCLVVNGSLHPASAAQVELARERGLFEGDWATCGRDPASVLRKLSDSRFDGLVVFGGDTAFDIHRALGADDFQACGEVAPGVPVSLRGRLHWVTKAGGFGAPELLCDIHRRLT